MSIGNVTFTLMIRYWSPLKEPYYCSPFTNVNEQCIHEYIRSRICWLGAFTQLINAVDGYRVLDIHKSTSLSSALYGCFPAAPSGICAALDGGGGGLCSTVCWQMPLQPSVAKYKLTVNIFKLGTRGWKQRLPADGCRVGGWRVARDAVVDKDIM